MSSLNKKEVEHLAELARLDLTEGEKEGLQKDLEKILNHFTELNEIDTEKVAPLTGGTSLLNVYREDEPERTDDTGRGVPGLPKSKDGFLEVPKIFE